MSLLLILSKVPRPGDPDAAFLRLLKRHNIPAVCFVWEPATTASAMPELRSGSLIWAEEDPSLRWQTLKSLLDQKEFRAVGLCGMEAFRELSVRVAGHVQVPCFAYLPYRKFQATALDVSRWLRGLRQLRLLLFETRGQEAAFNALLPRRHSFQTASLENDRVRWLSRLRRDLGRARPALTTLITPVHNRVDHTLRCVRSVLANTPIPFEWIIIDNGSIDSTPNALRRLAHKDRRIRVISNPRNLGFARAVNQGMRKARGETLVLLNNDVLVSADWLEGLLGALERDPGLGAVGPCTNQASDLHQFRQASYDLQRFDVFATAWKMRHEGRVREMYRLIGFCMALRREAYEQVGLLDDRFHVGGYEDYDYCLRMRQAGWRLGLAEEVFLHHFGHVSYKNEDSWLKTIAANREVFLDKWTRKSLEFLDNLSDLRLQRV